MLASGIILYSLSITTADSAVAGSDYEMTTMNLAFPISSMDNDIQCLNITIMEDTLVEGDETFAVTLTTALGVTTGTDITIITITDNEGIGCADIVLWSCHLCILPDATVSVPTAMPASEDSPTVRVCATLSLSPSVNTSTANIITITLATTNSTPGRDGVTFSQTTLMLALEY